MSRELSPESNVSNLVDYLLEKDVDIHISAPNYRSSSIRIKVDCMDAYDRPIRCTKRIDMIKYKGAVPEARNIIVTQTICELVKELDSHRL